MKSCNFGQSLEPLPTLLVVRLCIIVKEFSTPSHLSLLHIFKKPQNPGKCLSQGSHKI